jgi:hypothetical protein
VFQMSAVVGLRFRVQSMWRDRKPEFTKIGDKAHPILVWDLSFLERMQKGAIDLCIIVALVRLLLSLERGHQIVELLDMFVNSVGRLFDYIEDFLFEAKFILSGMGTIPLLKCTLYVGGSNASFDRGFVLSWDGLG